MLATMLLAALVLPVILGQELGCSGKPTPGRARDAEKDIWSSKAPSITASGRALADKYKREAKIAAERNAVAIPAMAAEEREEQPEDPWRPAPDSSSERDLLVAKDALSEKEVRAYKEENSAPVPGPAAGPKREAASGKKAEAGEIEYSVPAESSAYVNAKLLLRFLGAAEERE